VHLSTGPSVVGGQSKCTLPCEVGSLLMRIRKNDQEAASLFSLFAVTDSVAWAAATIAAITKRIFVLITYIGALQKTLERSPEMTKANTSYALFTR
jgi:hypothetical protein